MDQPTTATSRYSYEETVARLATEIAARGATLFAAIDQTAAATAADLTLRPTTLLVFGNPAAGTPLMARDPLVALALPVKIIVWEESGAVHLAYEKMSMVATRYDLAGLEKPVAAIDRFLDGLAGAVRMIAPAADEE